MSDEDAQEAFAALQKKHLRSYHRDALGVRLALAPKVDMEVIGRRFRISRKTAYNFKKYGVNLVTQNSPISEGTMTATDFNERLDRLERRLDEIARDTAETAERIRERFPNNKEVSEAVDRFLGEALSEAA